MNSGFITEMKDKNGDSWYHQIVVETQQEEIERLNNILKEIREYIKENEKEYGSLEDNEKIILEILDKGE